MLKSRPIKYSIRLTLVTLFIVSCTLVASVTLFLQYSFSTQQLKTNIVEKFDAFAKTTQSHIAHNQQKAADTVKLLASIPAIHKLKQREKLTIFAQALADAEHIHGIYYTDLVGNFFEVVRLRDTDTRQGYGAQDDEHWLVMKIRPKTAQRRLYYYDQSMKLMRKNIESTDYNATKRNWFINAENTIQHSAPYIFRYSQRPGITYYKKTNDKGAVIGLDIKLDDLTGAISERVEEFSGEAYFIRSDGEVITDNQQITELHNTAIPPLLLNAEEKALIDTVGTLTVSNSLDWAPVDFAISGEPKGYAVALVKLIAQRLGLDFAFINGHQWSELTSKFDRQELDVLNAVFNTQKNNLTGQLSLPIGELPYAVLTNNQNTIESSEFSLDMLINKRVAISEGWSIIDEIRTQHPLVDIIELPDSLAVINAVLDGTADAGIETAFNASQNLASFAIEGIALHPLHEPVLLPDTIHLLVQPKYKDLLPLINKAITSLQIQHIPRLQKQWLRHDHFKTIGRRVFPYLEYTRQYTRDNFGVLNNISHQGEQKFLYLDTISPIGGDQIAFVLTKEELFTPVYAHVYTSIGITLLLVLLLFPLTWLFASPIVKPISQLAAITKLIKQRRYEQVSITPSRIIEVKGLSLSIKQMSDEMQRHEKSQRKLIDAMIKLIAQAIDDKSPYTAGHCARVPELAIKLTEYACKDTSGHFAEFNFNSEQQWREFKTAAWLHDCGKITTPEHIVDKGSKLECIYNRIHEIRTRFEVLHRDAEIAYYKGYLSAPNDKQILLDKLAQTQATLRKEFEFIANCNVGGEFLSQQDMAEIARIGDRQWQRNFDDSLGLSPIEERTYGSKSQLLPVTEQLLSDKSEHIIPRPAPYQCPEHLGIKMDIPEHLGNLGERYNLSISRGTLSTEDRFRINEHIISTIKILDNMPFPAELANVPRIASTHHETIRGDGYPRQLKGEQLSIPEKILALADIFEALTASDRPYKKAKSLNTSIKILYQMAVEKHIDQDVFSLFLNSGCYLEYAKAYLDDAQMDHVDVEKYQFNSASAAGYQFSSLGDTAAVVRDKLSNKQACK